MSVEDGGISQEATFGDNWPIPSVLVEVIGSPNLSRLFAGLKIECPEEMQSFWLNTTSKLATEPNNNHCLSKVQLEQLSRPSERGGAPQDGGQNSRTSTAAGSVIRYSTTSRHNSNPLKYPHLDFLLSHKDDEVPLSPLSLSPFNELYVFPAQYSQSFATNLPTNFLSASQLDDLLSWNDKNLTSPLCHEQDPGIIYAMEEQAHTYFNQDNYLEAEHWYRKVLSARQRISDGDPAEILKTALDIISVAQQSGNIMAARKWHEEIHRTILRHFPPVNPLVFGSLRVREANFSLAGEYNDEENISRETLQAVLDSSGPKHKEAVRQFIYLSEAIINQHKYAEAEQLLMITLQLCKSVPQVNFKIVDFAMEHLAKALYLQGQTKLSLEWASCRAERAAARLGEDHPITMDARARVAGFLRVMGRIKESEDLFHSTLGSMVRLLGRRHQDTISCILNHGIMLRGEGRYSEAEAWFRESFELSLGLFGPEDSYTSASCDRLVFCLKKMRRFDEALQLCERYLQELRLREGITDQHKMIIKFQGWINETMECTEEQLRVLDIFVAEEQ
jgi:tetratricopeptide (TPR) repeat protein